MHLRALAFLLALPPLLQAQSTTASAVAGSALTAASGWPGVAGSGSVTVPIGTALPSNYQLPYSCASGSALFQATLLQQASGIRYTLRDASWQLATGRSSTGTHQTVLTVNLPQAMPVRITTTWFTNRWGGSLALPSTWIDIGDDGSHEWTGNWAESTHPVFTTVRTIPSNQLRIRTQTGSESFYTAGEASFNESVGPADLTIQVEPIFPFAAGNDQLTGIGEPFPQPLAARIVDASGNPVINTPVVFTVTGPASIVGPRVVNTDANGTATIAVIAGLTPGVIQASATAAGAPLFGTELFVTDLRLTRSSTSVQLEIANPAPTAGPVAYALLTSPPGIPPLATIIGPIATNPNDPATIVLEDSIGLFGFPSLSGTGCVGTPASVSKLYAIPPGFLAGVTLQFQAIGLDPVRGFFRTNAALLTF